MDRGWGCKYMEIKGLDKNYNRFCKKREYLNCTTLSSRFAPHADSQPEYDQIVKEMIQHKPLKLKDLPPVAKYGILVCGIVIVKVVENI